MSHGAGEVEDREIATVAEETRRKRRRSGDLAQEDVGSAREISDHRTRKVLRKLKDLEKAPGQMAGAGPTMLLREENGCCSRRQSSSSAGVSAGSGSEIEGQSGSNMGDGGGTAAPGSLWDSCESPAGCRELWFQGQAAAEEALSERVSRPAQDSDGEREDSPAARARQQLEALLNKTMRIRMTDGRTLVGCFLCTDRDCNVILGSAQEFLKPSGQCRGNAHPPGNAAEPHARHFPFSARLHPLFSGTRSRGSEGAGLTLACFPDALILLSRFFLCWGTPCAGPGHGTRTPHRFY